MVLFSAFKRAENRRNGFAVQCLQSASLNDQHRFDDYLCDDRKKLEQSRRRKRQ